MKKNLRKTIRIISSLLTAALLISLTACGSSASSSEVPTVEGAKYVFKLAGIGTSATQIDPVAVGIEKGFFAEEGIEVKDVGEVDVLQFVALLESGSVDAGLTMESDIVAAIDVGADIVEVAVGPAVTREKPHMAYVVLENSPIKSGADIKAAKIGLTGLNGCNVGFLYEYAALNGIKDPARELDVTSSSAPALLEALRAGQLDLTALHGTTNEEVIKRIYPDLRVLFTDYDFAEDRAGDIGWCLRRSWAEEDPDRARAFVAAIAKSNNFVNNNPEEALEIYRKVAKTELNEKIFQTPYYAKDGLIQESHVQYWIDTLSKPNSFQPLQNKDIKFEDVATNKYNPHK
ncbi:ABC transporter substrate-binding protein [Desulfitobacterium chlororespirans]|uniref:ABC-type nitrate/sulfonate/bicarbonate transport system, substrate-binding protein n=1 Tax=Desulfitobacterium chlororespirans DSM 11544 TaxID=1121395 RepID=A0A1M7RY29_9FIRM|nr:ABC transporter substrate-binding protein [Desulfitobacterium chlororespirans]SHN51217.1 ABC-type nitrate/sulfonate/bicarbonate transport system, substrate-binding protein [Desulfitobacterium chlororespirans DSM 11544]